jgi:hypothetical protein
MGECVTCGQVVRTIYGLGKTKNEKSKIFEYQKRVLLKNIIFFFSWKNNSVLEGLQFITFVMALNPVIRSCFNCLNFTGENRLKKNGDYMSRYPAISSKYATHEYTIIPQTSLAANGKSVQAIV